MPARLGGQVNPGAVSRVWDGGLVVANGTYVLIGSAPYPLTVSGLDYEVGSAAGSFTVAVNNGATAVTGLSAVAVSSATKASAAATGNAAVASGGRVTAVVTAVAGSPSGAVLTLRFNRA